MNRLFSPNQVGIGSFVGGPFAAVYLLWSNFRALGNASAARATLLWGIVFIVALLAILPFLPEKFPNLLIPVIYTVIARLIAERFQMTKRQIAQSEQFDFQSNWLVAGLSVLCLAIFFLVGVILLLALDALGIALPY
jgi:uncharacterized membrane protein YkvI